MKILWVKAGKLLPLNTGGKIRSFNILKQLSAHHDVTLLSYYGGQRDSEYETQLAKYFPHAVCCCTDIPDDTNNVFERGIHYLSRLFHRVPYAVEKFTSDEVQGIVKEYVTSGRFHVAVCDFLAASLNFPDVLPTLTILFQHNVEATLWQRQARWERNWIKKAVFALEAMKMMRYEPAAIRKFQHVVAVSEEDRQLMLRAAPAHVAVVPTGVDLQQFRAAGVSRILEPIVMFTGSMDWEANIDAMEYFCKEIWPRVLSAVPEARFQIVGRNPHPRVKRLASSSVQVTGTVPAVIDYLKDASVVVVPLRIGGGTRLKIFEAMAMAKPVVSTSIGAEGLDVKHGRDIVLSDNPSDFSHCVVKLLREELTRERLGAAARETAGRYEWSVIGSHFEDVLTRMVRSSRSVEHPREAEVIA